MCSVICHMLLCQSFIFRYCSTFQWSTQTYWFWGAVAVTQITRVMKEVEGHASAWWFIGREKVRLCERKKIWAHTHTHTRTHTLLHYMWRLESLFSKLMDPFRSHLDLSGDCLYEAAQRMFHTLYLYESMQRSTRRVSKLPICSVCVRVCLGKVRGANNSNSVT